MGLLGILGAIPAIDAAVALVNRGVMRGFGATPLPALELRNGVPSHLRTLVAVPLQIGDSLVAICVLASRSPNFMTEAPPGLGTP